MKLYEVPRNTDIDVSHLGLESGGEKIETVHFHHIDGVYSYCTWNGEVVHLSASTEVKIL